MRVSRRRTRPRHHERQDEIVTTRVVALLRAGRCYVCEGLVEDGLARVGSTLCHDCRAGRVRVQ
jgi:hypothetical protein